MAKSIDFRSLVAAFEKEDMKKPVVVYELAAGDYVEEYPNGKKIVRIVKGKLK